MASYTVYDANKCTATFGGMAITGFSSDMIEGEKDEEFFSTSVGAQGDVVVSEKNNPLGTVKFTLQPTSPQYRTLVQCGTDGTIAPLWVKNSTTGMMFGGSKARLKKYPTFSEGEEASDGEFEFQVFDYEVSKISDWKNLMPDGTTVSSSGTAGTWTKS